MAVTAAHGSEGTRLARKTSRVKPLAGVGRHRYRSRYRISHSTGTINSLLRSILRFTRAAASIVRGSVLRRCTSVCNVWFTSRSDSTSCCIAANCCDAILNFARVRMLTVTHTARVASRIIPNTTQEGMIPPRRRTSVRLPMMSSEICWTVATEGLTLGATRCDLIRSSTQ